MSDLERDLEPWARLSSILDTLADEGERLAALEDVRLRGVLEAIGALEAEVIAALAMLAPPAHDN